MSIPLRLVPAALAALLIVVRLFQPDFLSQKAFWIVSWWVAIMVPLLYLAAWALTPPFVRLFNVAARRFFLLPAFFLALAVGTLWFIEWIYNSTLGNWCESCPTATLVGAFTRAFTGG